MSIAALLYRCRRVLPERVSELLVDAFWERFWQDEERALGDDLGRVPLASGAVTEDPTLEGLALRDSERAQLIERVASYYPFTTVLELGCAFGQNFYTLAKLFPKAEFLGIDLDPTRVAPGNVLLLEAGISNATLIEGDVRALEGLGKIRFDVIYSCASLLYLPAVDVVNAIAALKQFAPRAVVLLEQNVDASDPRHGGDAAQGFSTSAGGGVAAYWHRDYRLLLERVFPEAKVAVVQIEAPRWATEEWRKYGSLIVAEFR